MPIPVRVLAPLLDFLELVLFSALPQRWTTRVLEKWQSGRGINREGAEELTRCLISRGNGQLNRQERHERQGYLGSVADGTIRRIAFSRR